MKNEKTKTINEMYRLAKAVRETYGELYFSLGYVELKPFTEKVEECIRKLVEVESDLFEIGNGIY